MCYGFKGYCGQPVVGKIFTANSPTPDHCDDAFTDFNVDIFVPAFFAN